MPVSLVQAYDFCGGDPNCYVEPTTAMSAGQSQTFTYQFCPQVNVQLNAGASMTGVHVYAGLEGMFVDASVWSFNDTIQPGACANGSFVVSVPAGTAAGNYSVAVYFYCKWYASDGEYGYCHNDQAEYYYPLTITGASPQLSDSLALECTPQSIEVGNGSASCSARLVYGSTPLSGTISFTSSSATGVFDPAVCTPDPNIGRCDTTYTDTTAGNVTITASYSGGSDYPPSSDIANITVTAQESKQCPALWLTEGLSPAAPATGDDNIYITIHWNGVTPVGVVLGALPRSATTSAHFTFNPVTMYASTLSVLMDVTTHHTPDGVYMVTVTAALTDPATGEPCGTTSDMAFTVRGTAVFTTTMGNTTGSALWPPGLDTPILITGNVSSAQFSNVKPTLDQNSRLLTLDFTLTGPPGTNGETVLTIPKNDLPPGTKPVLTEGGARVTNQQLTEDANSYFIWFVTPFSTHTFHLQLEQVMQSASTTAASSQNSSGSASSSTTVVVSTPSVAVVTEAAAPQNSGGEAGSLVPAEVVAVVMLAMGAVVVVVMRRRPTNATP